MKNVINYYYNILFDDIYQNKKSFYFDHDNYRYFFSLFEGDLNSLQNIYKLHSELLKRNIYVHQIILNKDNQIITFVNGNPYILLKSLYHEKPISLENILAFSQLIINTNEKYNLKKLWEDKNDHLEYQVKQIRNRYPLIKESFDYFLSLAENSIQLLNEIQNIEYPITVAHKRINSNDTSFELYNPLNLIIDTRVRDVAEYFKSKFFNGEDIEKEMNLFLNQAKLTTTEYYLFLARMFYPTYYFDIYEDIISGKKKEEEIKKITSKISDYELILKKIYNKYKKFIMITPIEWLETI